MTLKKAIALSLAVICLGLFCFSLCGCFLFVESPDDYTLEEHLARIAPRIEKRYINPETRRQEYNHITDYKLYPLYDNEDKLHYFLIEFEPYGFAFVGLRETRGYYKAMYKRDDAYIWHGWYRYRVCIDGVEPEPYEGRQWLPMERSYNDDFRFEVNEHGEFVEYKHSPYTVAGVLDRKLYMLDIYNYGVPAIKQGDKYFNLVSMDEFVCEGDWQYYKKLYNGIAEKAIPALSFGFIIKSYFDL